VAKVTITIQDEDTTIGIVTTKIEVDPMPGVRFITQAHVLGDVLYQMIPIIMNKMEGGEKDGKKEEG